MQAQILAPAAVLVVWSLIMLFWMAGVRLPALKKAGIDLGARPGGRGQDLEGQVDPKINWPSHNYSHLMEQPTLFYATALTLALLSPARRPVQVTKDLPGFWAGSWAAVRADMRGRYPRHPWPDDPWTATATHRAKPRGT